MSETRKDGYTDAVLANNPASGLQGKTFLDLWLMQDLLMLYLTNNLAARIVDLPVDGAFSRGFEFEEDPDDTLKAEFERLEISRKLATGQRWAQLFGASALIVIADDANDMRLPLNEKAIGTIAEFRPVDLTSISRTGNIVEALKDPLYGQTATYMVQPKFAGMPQEVHASRILPLSGDDLPDVVRRSAILPWMGRSCLWGCADEIRRYDRASNWSERMLERKQQLVYLMEGMATYLEETRDPVTGISSGESMVTQRMQIIDKIRSVLNTIVIDGGAYNSEGKQVGAGDRVEVKDLNMSNVPQMFNIFQMTLSAKTKPTLPVTVLFGRSAAGMNATGDGDLEVFYAGCGELQKRVHPLVNRIRELIRAQASYTGSRTDGCLVSFAPIWLPSELEQAQANQQNAFANLQNAQAAASNITAGIISADVMARWFETEGLFGITEEDLASRLEDITDEQAETMLANSENMRAAGIDPNPPAPVAAGGAEAPQAKSGAKPARKPVSKP